LASQLEPEWNVEKIVTHQFAGTDAVFLVQWGTSDQTWLPYLDIQHVEALQDYLDVLGVKKIKNLRPLKTKQTDDAGDNVQVFEIAPSKEHFTHTYSNADDAWSWCSETTSARPNYEVFKRTKRNRMKYPLENYYHSPNSTLHPHLHSIFFELSPGGDHFTPVLH
jgi:hypothetical protein